MSRARVTTRSCCRVCRTASHRSSRISVERSAVCATIVRRAFASAGLARSTSGCSLVANGRYCGNAMCIAPGARIDDGMLDVVTIAAIGIPRLLLLAPRLYGGGLARDRAVQAFESPWLKIDASPPVMVEADGQRI